MLDCIKFIPLVPIEWKRKRKFDKGLFQNVMLMIDVLTCRFVKSCENCAARFFQYSSSSCGPEDESSRRSCSLSIKI